MLKSLSNVECTHDLSIAVAGSFQGDEFEQDVRNLDIWNNVDYHGLLRHDEVRNLLKQAKIGLATYRNTGAYSQGIPVKVFEYMLFGLPVVIPRFMEVSSFVSDNEVGLSVSGTDGVNFDTAVTRLLEEPKQAYEMGRSGYRLVRDRYNWENELPELERAYRYALE